MSIFNSDLEHGEIGSALKDVKGVVHFVGILGSGMFPLAKILHRRGYRVSGSDDKASPEFNDAGIRITRPQKTLDREVSLVVYSLAISEDNSEILCAKSRGITLISRAQLLGYIMRMYKTRISVSGSHGKSTTTALLDHIFGAAALPHTTVCGAALSSGEPFTDTGGDIFIAEACEYKDSFLRLSPTHQLITSVELDHTDYFKTAEQLRASFLKAAESSDTAFINCDDSVAAGISDEIKARGSTVITYGCSAHADYRLSDISQDGVSTRFSVVRGDRELVLTTSLIGRFNLYNITAAIAVADTLGVGSDDIARAVSTFQPIERRMTLVTVIDEIPVYYDYAHHPSEIRAAISAIRERHGAVTVIFRPHTYSRTQSLWNDFITEFSKADFTILLDIYPARENEIDGVNSKALADMIENCVYANMNEAAHLALSRPTGAIALLGAGEVDSVLRDLMEIGESTGYVPERR